MTDTMEALQQSAKALEGRLCTCHPDDNPPRPCPQKFALTHCQRAALLTNIRDTMRHARVFLCSREKIHPDGLALYQEVLERVEAAIAAES